MKCLLVMPLHFYSFSSHLGKALENQGYEITNANDEYPRNLAGRFLSKFGFSWLIQKFTHLHFKRHFLHNNYYDVVVIIKGRGFSSSLLKDLEACSDRIIGYHFDSFSVEAGPSRWITDVRDISTFDYLDAKSFKLKIVELFSTLGGAGKSGPSARNLILSAMVKNHSDRLSYIDEVVSIFPSHQVFIYIFEGNYLSFIGNMIRSPFLTLKYFKHIHFEPLSHADYAAILQTSEFTLDFAHPRQHGITMRCFEAASTGTRVITNNKNINKSCIFEDSMFVVHSFGSCLESLSNTLHVVMPKPRIYNDRSAEDFVRNLLED
jgi:hypothetical protein